MRHDTALVYSMRVAGRRAGWLWIGVLLCSAPAAGAGGEHRLSLERVGERQLPPGWRVDATRPAGPLAEWGVHADPTAPGGNRIISIQRLYDGSRGVFNLLWSREPVFRDGELEVRVRANSGRIDQGGGLIWRVTDANNYYIARYNPLERNFRLYCVKEGRRSQLASVEGLKIGTGEWFHLRIAHEGRRIRGWINYAPAWDVNDEQLTQPGGIGLWSKADAASSFGALVVRAVPRAAARATIED